MVVVLSLAARFIPYSQRDCRFIMLTTESTLKNTLNRSAVKAYGRGRQIEFILNDRLPMEEVERELRAYLANTEGRYKGAEATLNVGRRIIAGKLVGRLRKVLEDEFKLLVMGFSCHPETLENMLSDEPHPFADLIAGAVERPAEDVAEWQETMLVRGTCRSGTVVHNDGHVVVMGDVNPGAEITATGDIVIFGSLRGLAHAGMKGAKSSVIVSLAMEAAQVRIGPYIQMRSRTHNRAGIVPEMALVRGEEIVVKTFNPRAMPKQEEE